jgi:hypothetical protein
MPSLYIIYWGFDDKICSAIEFTPAFRKDGIMTRFSSDILRLAMENKTSSGTPCKKVAIHSSNLKSFSIDPFLGRKIEVEPEKFFLTFDDWFIYAFDAQNNIYCVNTEGWYSWEEGRGGKTEVLQYAIDHWDSLNWHLEMGAALVDGRIKLIGGWKD